MNALPVWKLSAVIGAHLLMIFLLRGLLMARVVTSAPLPSQPSRLFFLDYALFLASGIAIAIYNNHVFGFPFFSGFKVVIGFATMGLIPSLDLSLNQEYRVICGASNIAKEDLVGRPYLLQTRKFIFLISGAFIFLTFTMLLIFLRENAWDVGQVGGIDWFVHLFSTVFGKIIFVMGTFLGMTLIVVFSYARNLHLLFTNQTVILNKVSKGDLHDRVPIVTNDEFAVIAEHTNAMIDRLVEREQMSKGLELARQIQANLLPKASPLLPGVQVFGSSVFCDETGGDFYDFFIRDISVGPELVIMVGDVTGHGVGAALLMTSARAYMRANLSNIDDIGKSMEASNAKICQDVAASGNFITMYLLTYCPTTRQVRWVSAGHNPAVFWSFTGKKPLELAGEDIPLGVDAEWKYAVHEFHLQPGILLLSTDGIWEAMDAENAMFGKVRLNHVVEENLDFAPQHIIDQIFKAIDAFIGAVPPEDDRTLVVARFV